MLMLVTGSVSLKSSICLIISSEGSDHLVALEYSLDSIRSNMGVVLKEKFKIKNRYDKLEIFHRIFCLKHEVCWWRKCRNFFGSFSFYVLIFNLNI